MEAFDLGAHVSCGSEELGLRAREQEEWKRMNPH